MAHDSPPITDLYAILEVPPGAGRDQVVRAWKRLAKRYHPDVNRDPGAAVRMTQLNVARSWLADPARRARYEATRLSPKGRDAPTVVTHRRNVERAAAQPGSARFDPHPIEALLARARQLTPEELVLLGDAVQAAPGEPLEAARRDAWLAFVSAAQREEEARWRLAVLAQLNSRVDLALLAAVRRTGRPLSPAAARAVADAALAVQCMGLIDAPRFDRLSASWWSVAPGVPSVDRRKLRYSLAAPGSSASLATSRGMGNRVQRSVFRLARSWHG